MGYLSYLPSYQLKAIYHSPLISGINKAFSTKEQPVLAYYFTDGLVGKFQ